MRKQSATSRFAPVPTRIATDDLGATRNRPAVSPCDRSACNGISTTKTCWQVGTRPFLQLFARLAWGDKLDRKSDLSNSEDAISSLGKRQPKQYPSAPIAQPSGTIFNVLSYLALRWVITRRSVHAALAVALFGCPALLFSQTDEIQVYDAAIAEPGVFNLMIHTNFTPIGRETPDFPNAIVANHSFQSTAEWAYGVTDWFEQGLYLPVTSLHSENHGATINGFKLRELFVRPHADDHKFFYGVNFEFSVNALYWEPKRITSEIRPIVGLHLKPWDFIFNPIVDTDYTGGFKNLEFNPSTRVAYNLNDHWAVAAEEYAGFGPLRGFVPVSQQFQEVWAVVDHTSGIVNIEAGVGVGVTGGSDRLTLKLMVSRDLNHRSKH